MRRLRVLITNITLALRTGTEINVRDLALALLARGHQPIVYSSDPGVVAEEIARATVPVVSDLADIGAPPDVIHGHHHPELVQALLHFPGVPAIFVSHDALAWHDAAPRFARIRRYLAVDEANLDRIVCQHGIPAERASMLLNAVDLARFPPRAPLPACPSRALVFSNYAREDSYLGAIREACRRSGLSLDVVGSGVGRAAPAPEALLGQYDLVFAKARCALEALAVGAAVVLCDYAGSGPMVTSGDLARLRRLNFGRRLLTGPLDADALVRQIARYDATDAARVSAWIREDASLDHAVAQLLRLYEEVIAEQAADPIDPLAESRSLADYLRDWGPRFKDGPLRTEVEEARVEVAGARGEIDRLRGEVARLHGETDQLRAESARLGGETDRLALERDTVGRARETLASEHQRLTTELQGLVTALHAARSDGGRLEAELEGVRRDLAYLTSTATWALHERVVTWPLAVGAYRLLRHGVRLARRLLPAPAGMAGRPRRSTR
jgi:hypothetical protein